MSLAEHIVIERPPMKRHIRRKPRKASAAPITLASPGDRGATGAANLERMVEEERGVNDEETGKLLNPNGYKGNRRQPWFERYASKGKLSHQQHAAAARLFAAYEGFPARDPLAALGESVDKSLWGSDPMAAKVDQKREFYRMWASVPLSSRPVIEHVVLNDRPLRAMAGCNNSHSEERHMQRLCAGLDAIS